MSVTRNVVVAIVVVLLAGTGAGYYFYAQNQEKPDATARAYLQAWEEGEFPVMEDLSLSAPARFAEVYQDIPSDMGASGYSFELETVTQEGNTAVAPFTATWELDELGEFSYRTQLDLERQDEQWHVVWSPASVHPDFTVNSSFRRQRNWPQRGRLLTFDGEPITDERRVVIVGIEPQRITDRASMIQALVDNLGVDPAEVNADLDRPGLRGDWFLPVIEIPAEQYEVVREIIHPVPGLVFQDRQRRLPPSEGFAGHVIGRVGEVTAEGLEQLGEPYRVGDEVGRSGLEAAFERSLAGEPALELRLTTPDGSADKVLLSRAGEPGADLETTLSVPVQNAAEAALEGVTEPAAIVVVDIATSQVRAAVSRPIGEFNRAFGGRYPPGSAFKVVSAASLLAAGISPEAPASCPPTVNVGGRSFRNFEGDALGEITFRQVFIASCNTGIIGLAEEIDAEELRRGAGTFGFNRDYAFPLNVAGGSYPEPGDATEKAAATIGQGRVLASPLHMATVAAAVAGGGWQAPTLTSGDEASDRIPLDTALGENLRTLMTAAVAEGTGVAAQVPGRVVAGKTGTAEFGDETPPRTHAWFIGFSGEYAFAVVVEGGGVGGQIAAPIAARLIAGL